MPDDVGLGTRSPRRAPSSRKPLGRALGASLAELEGFHRDFFLPLVWRATYRHGLVKEDAKDVVQEAFVLAMTKLRGDGNPRAWLNQVVDHLCANHLRKASRRACLEARWTRSEPSSESDPEESSE